MKRPPRTPKRPAHPAQENKAPAPRREKRKRWVQRGSYAVEVEVEVVYPPDEPDEPCLEPATVRWLDEIARKAEEGDVAYLRRAGRVFRLVLK